MRQLVTTQTIKQILPIEGADAIELILFEDILWRCVAKKGEFKVGDKALYFEIDSLLPQIEEFSFLANKGTKTTIIGAKSYTGYRLRTIRLRGQISQGLALPLSMFDIDLEGDLAEQIGVVKYEPEIKGDDTKGLFPTFLHKTDETRVQSLPHLFNQYPDEELYATLKYDGQSMTVYKLNGEYGVCKRNFEVKEGGKLWSIAETYKLQERLPEGYALQGEAYGVGIQSNPHKIEGRAYVVFNVYDIINCRYLDRDEFEAFCKEIEVPYTEILHTIQLKDHTFESLMELADQTGLEGLVFRPFKEQIDNKIGRLSFKVISNNYLL